jgi:hypothetical protein
MIGAPGCTYEHYEKVMQKSLTLWRLLWQSRGRRCPSLHSWHSAKLQLVDLRITTHEKSTFVYTQSSPIASALRICDRVHVRSGRHGVRRDETVGPVMGEIRQQERDQ